MYNQFNWKHKRAGRFFRSTAVSPATRDHWRNDTTLNLAELLDALLLHSSVRIYAFRLFWIVNFCIIYFHNYPIALALVHFFVSLIRRIMNSAWTVRLVLPYARFNSRSRNIHSIGKFAQFVFVRAYLLRLHWRLSSSTMPWISIGSMH